MKGEIWKDIEGFEGKYQISNMGNVKSLNYKHTGKEEILKPYADGHGYLKVFLYKDGKRKNCRVNRLVAIAFCENPHGFKEVNHIDEDKTNNNADNLEWCSRSYNCNYGTRNNRVAEKMRGRKQSEEHIKKRSKPIIGIDKVTGLIVEFPSAREAERQTGIANQSICACCKGKQMTAKGYTFFYANTDDAE